MKISLQELDNQKLNESLLQMELSKKIDENHNLRNKLSIQKDQIRLSFIEQIANLQSELEQQKQEYEKLITSTSWSITTPLRKIGKRFPNITRPFSRMLKLFSLSLPSQFKNSYSVKDSLILLKYNRVFRKAQFKIHDLCIALKIIKSDFFDQKYYLRNTLIHFIKEGGALGAHPHPLFDTPFYVGKHPELWGTQANPLIHYLTSEMDYDDPSPLFNSRYYHSQDPHVKKTGLSALQHYMRYGAKENRNTSIFFCPHHYRTTNSIEASNSINLLEHYLEFGRKQGFQTNAYGIECVSLRISSIMRFTHLVQDLRAYAQAIELNTSEKPQVSIILPVYNQVKFTLRCLKALSLNTEKTPYEVIVIDNCSSDETETLIPTIKGLRYIRNNNNLGFLRSCNRAAKEAKGDYILLLNNDCLTLPGWLDNLISTFSLYPNVGLVGAKLLYPDGTLQEAGGIIWSDGTGWNYGRGKDPHHCHYNYVRDVDYCSGACIIIPSKLWHDLKGFDEAFVPAYYEDTDLAFRIRQSGYRVLYQPTAEVIHFEGITHGRNTNSGEKIHQKTNRFKFVEHWENNLIDFISENDIKKRYLNRSDHKQILIIDASTPTPDQDAGSIVTFQFMKIFRELNMGVTFIPDEFHYHGKYTRDLQEMGIECCYRPYFDNMEEYLKREGARFDIVMLYRATVANNYIDLIYKYTPLAKIIFHTIDLHFLRMEREATLTNSSALMKKAQDLKKMEMDVIKKADKSIVVSEMEYELLKEEQSFVSKIAYIPIPTNLTDRLEDFDTRKNILFVGNFNHTPNQDALTYFVHEIFPYLIELLPDVKLQIIGSNMPDKIRKLASTKIHILGHVKNLDDIFSKCRLSVAPLRFGAGVKGKIITSLSYGVPCVATSIAVEGMKLTQNESILIADCPQKFAESIVTAYKDKKLWEKLSRNGLDVVRTNFSIEIVKSKLIKLLNDL